MISGLVAASVAFLQGAPGWAISLAGLAASLVVIGSVGLYFTILHSKVSTNGKQNLSRNTGTMPLRIEFEDTNPVRWCKEMHRIFSLQEVTYKFYGVSIYNFGTVDVEDVSVEVEKIEQLQDKTGELVPFPSLLNLRLRFKDGSTSKRFAPGFRERVPVISHSNSVAIDSEFRMESTQIHRFEHNKKRQRIYLKVTASGVQPLRATFIAWIDGSGELQMHRE